MTTENKALNKKKSFLDIMIHNEVALSVLVILLGFLVATILVALIGKNPVGIYKTIIQIMTGYNFKKGNFNIRYVGDWFAYSMPMILCGFSMAFAYKAGLFNVGGEGQYIVGLTVAQLVACTFPQIPVVHTAVAVLLAVIAASIWGGVVGFLKAKFEVSEVVSTIMMNYIALYLSRIVTMAIPGTNTYKTVNFPATCNLHSDFLYSITNKSMLGSGIFLTIIAIFVYWILMDKTKFGYALRATGFNKDAARCSGIPVVNTIVGGMSVAGAFAGLAGAIVALGAFSYGRVLSGMDNYGFTGMAVALVGNCSAIGTTLAGMFFGLLSAGQTLMQSYGIPKEIVYLIQGLVVVFIALKTGYKLFFSNIKKRREEKLLNSMNQKEGK
ncbi:MAG: ABC transporter permease [Treponema sp.]|nr:ABC transporter permease [Treponema sp.]